MKKEKVFRERRKILINGATLTGLALSGMVLPAIIPGCENDTLKSVNKDEQFDVSSEKALAVEGGAVYKIFGENNGGRPVVIIRSGAKRFVVLTSVCAHQGCQVGLPDSLGGDIVCPCHGSRYSSLDGSVKQGPTTAPLRQYTSSFDSGKNILTISF